MPSPFPPSPDHTRLLGVQLPRGELATNELVTALEWAWRVVPPKRSSAAGIRFLAARQARIEALMPRLGAALERYAGWSARDWSRQLESPHRPDMVVRVLEGGEGTPFPSGGEHGAELVGPSSFALKMTEQEAVDLLRGCQLRCRQRGLAPKPGRSPSAGWLASCEVGRRVAEAVERAFAWAPGTWERLGREPIQVRLEQLARKPQPAIR